MFIDKVRITVKGGKGGAGCLSFRREKYVPYGGPNGGNGGKGGDVWLQADSNLYTLLDLTYRPYYQGKDGEPGQGSDKYGKGGSDLTVFVPCGTVVMKNGQRVADLLQPGERFLAASGGRGGRGNAAFKSNRNKTPRIAEKGAPGEQSLLDLELKVIADVGLVGCPNAGKSTLLSRITSARPKIASYPFTTLSPNLGVAGFHHRSFVVADIPGLIEGAHLGKGLGDEFLRHIERTRVLVHIVDAQGFEGQTAYEAYRAVQKELDSYSPSLAKKPALAVFNKMDVTGSEALLKTFRQKIGRKKVYAISAVTGQGLPELMSELVKLLSKQRQSPVDHPEVLEYVVEPKFTLEKQDCIFLVSGAKIEQLTAMTNFDQEEAVRRFQNLLKAMGIEKALARQGVKAGDTVRIGSFEFSYTPLEEDLFSYYKSLPRTHKKHFDKD